MHPMLDPLEALYVSIHAIQTRKDLAFEVIKDNFDNIFGSDSRAVSSGGALLVDGAFETSSSISALRVSLVWAKAPVGVVYWDIGAFLQIITIIINNNIKKIFELQKFAVGDSVLTFSDRTTKW